MVSTRPLISNSSCPCTNPLVIVPRGSIITDIATFMFHSSFSSLAKSRYLSFCSLSFNFTLSSVGTAKSTIWQVLFFCCCWLLLGEVAWPRSGDPFVSKNPRGVCVSYSPGLILTYAYTICLYGQIKISCTVPSGPPCPPRCVWSCTLSVLICRFRLLYDWLFRVSHLITYICCFVASYLFLLWYD